MAEVFAGWMMGFAYSLLIAPVAAWAMVAPREREPWMERVAPRGTNVVALTMVLHMLAVLLATALGIVLGLALAGLEDRRPASGLGSPNVAYTLMVLALTAVIFIPMMLVPPLRRYALPGAFAFALLFGWATPWLAQAG